MQSRRTALVTLASASLTPLLAPASAAAAEAVFSSADSKTIERLVDLILPRTDTPGAVDAGVPYRIDRQVTSDPELQATFRAGLAYLAAEAEKAGAPDFNSLPAPRQLEILEAMSTLPSSPGAEFFQSLKSLTIDWYYRSEQGLVQELGFKGNTFRAEFPGCTHPEHWPTQESNQEHN